MGTLYQNGEQLFNMAPLSDTFTGPDYDAASMRLVKELKASIDGMVNLIYPVGSIYFSVNNINPGTFLTGTTWEAYGAADTYLRLGGTGTGGSNTTKLTAAQIPSLTTGNQSANHTHSGTTLSAVSNGAHAHGLSYWTANDLGKVATDGYVVGNVGANNGNLKSFGQNTTSNGAHTHSITGNTGANSANHTHTYTNNAQTDVAIEPKYIQTYAWKRIA